MNRTTKLIYLYIREFMKGSGGRPPTIRDIGKGVRPERPLSTSLVCHHLNYLEELGCIERVPIRDTGKRVIQLPGAAYEAPPILESLKLAIRADIDQMV